MSFVNISCDQLFAILLFGGQELMAWASLTFQIDRLVIKVNDSQCLARLPPAILSAKGFF